MSSKSIARHASSEVIRGWGPAPLWLERFFALNNSIIDFGEKATKYYEQRKGGSS